MPESALISQSEAESMFSSTSIQAEMLALDSQENSSESNFEVESIELEDHDI